MAELFISPEKLEPPLRNGDNNKIEGSCQVNSSFSIKNHKRNYSFKLYPHCIEFSAPPWDSYPYYRSITKRGRIKSFSYRARFRMFRLMAKIKSNLIRSPLFITLTYHHGHEVDTSIHRDHFHNFLTQLRVLDDNIQYIWRLEYQKRGAPHYHLILFPSLSLRRFPDLWYSGRLTFIWHSISDPDSIAHSKYGFKLTSIKSYQMACSYISKYCGKVDVINEVKTGFKQWGNSRNLPIQVNLRLDVDREKAYNYLEIIRTWLLKQGKAQFESHEFFNISCDQTIFIDYTVSMDLLNELYNMFDTF